MRDGVHYKVVISLKQCNNRNITARIPHQSRFARQLPPGGSHALRANTLVSILPGRKKAAPQLRSSLLLSDFYCALPLLHRNGYDFVAAGLVLDAVQQQFQALLRQTFRRLGHGGQSGHHIRTDLQTIQTDN